MGITVSTLSCAVSSWPVPVPEVTLFSWLEYLPVCCDLHGVHRMMCTHAQAFAFPHDNGSCSAFSAANTCLAKQADTWTSLAWSPPLHRSRRVSQAAGGSLQDLDPEDYLWHPLRTAPRKTHSSTRLQGLRCLHCLQVVLMKVTDLFSHLSAPRGASWPTHPTHKT